MNKTQFLQKSQNAQFMHVHFNCNEKHLKQ